ncbi:hypothetical protein Slin15195_G118530 [Septoria linicola]|uniref:Uncharacterized protein n=1 Tax=Septoria linicola TaxID=215465 RepID=A0A9Q9B038_9PEZI|nr:hypothetical protein Slin14017_G095520 [Septoria linicola]USW58534.1 hypothetical protein Slin15195_G118530 [Septoria linicola]
MKGISCFSRKSVAQDLDDEAPRTPRKKGRISRQGSNQSQASRCSTASNSSISKLPPCKRVSDPHIEAMMMPVPPEARQSRCLRMSHPRIYSNIVDDMKRTRKSRAWKDFQVFHTDEIDMTISAVDMAAKKAAQYERMVREMSSFGDSNPPCGRRSVDAVDMIG